MGMELVYVPAGSWMMGSDTYNDEKPIHQVTMREGFYMGRYEVTQAQWTAVMGTNPSRFKGDNLPVETVSWDDAQGFIRKLNARGDGFSYHLPSEAEWEYAARAGTTTAFAFGDSLSSEQANFNGDYPYGGAAKGVYREKTTPVGSFQPNGWGLYDMHGNVWEWCEDWSHDNYNGAPSDGSAWESGGEQKERVLRGGSWGSYAAFLRSANRGRNSPDYRDSYDGFRVVAMSRSS
jgi:formylglycine-generating enzyme required for sulfatase activity